MLKKAFERAHLVRTVLHAFNTELRAPRADDGVLFGRNYDDRESFRLQLLQSQSVGASATDHFSAILQHIDGIVGEHSVEIERHAADHVYAFSEAARKDAIRRSHSLSISSPRSCGMT